MDLENRLKRYKNIHPEDREALGRIFQDISDDPDWYEDSFLFEIFSKRIPAYEFISLFFSDEQWSHIANKKQSDQILELFNKVYGYIKGLSRLEE